MNIYPPGSIIASRYEVVGRPLLGGMGIVYLCMDRQEDQPVALKTFRPEFLPDRATRDRFLREGTTWLNLGKHPHIVQCNSVERVGGGREVYLVLELVAKEQGLPDASLRSWQYSAGKPLPLDMALIISIQIVRAMRYATEVIPGFVHRDLKPENILIGADQLPGIDKNRVRVTDFGLANVVEVSGQQSEPRVRELFDSVGIMGCTQLTDGIVGTPLYMAPEQWQRGKLGIWTDVYALGCIIYEMLTGYLIAEGKTLEDLRRAHCKEKAPQMFDRLPQAVRSQMKRFLAVNWNERYKNWADVDAELTLLFSKVTRLNFPSIAPLDLQTPMERINTGWSFNEIGVSYLDISLYTRAQRYFELAKEIGKSEGEKRLVGVALNHLGLVYRNLGNYRKAIECFDQVLEFFQGIGNKVGICTALNGIGNAYADLGQVHEAIQYYERALTIAKEIEDRKSECVAVGGLGVIYVDIGEYNRAIEYLEQFYEISKEMGDRIREMESLTNLGVVCKEIGETQAAIWHHERALEISREIGHRHGEGNALGNLGNAYYELGDAGQAIWYHEQALKISQEIGDQHGEATDYGNLGLAHVDQGDYRLGIECYEHAINIFEKIESLLGIANTYFNMAIAYKKTNEQTLALQSARKAKKMFSQVGNQEATLRSQAMIDDLLNKKDEWDSIPNKAEILGSFSIFIDEIVRSALVNREQRFTDDPIFDMLEKQGTPIIKPIRRIWDGERNEAALISGLDPLSSIIVHEILERLKEQESKL